MGSEWKLPGHASRADTHGGFLLAPSRWLA